ncbi:MAG: hypothetical protein H5U18_09905 [Rhodobacteraceae bacterium]|nr:hypothetical protein [Paracoccaceae bacterium]
MPAVAATYQDDLERQLRREGYRITYQKRTWLGRIRIQAMNGLRRREVVLDPSSGEILRDYTEDTGRDRSSQASGEGSGGSPSSGSTGEAGSGEGGSPSEEPSREPSKEPSKEPSRDATGEGGGATEGGGDVRK